jgi:septum site-determining protein MinC
MGIVIKGVTVPALMIKLDRNKTVEENIAELEEKLSSAFFKGSMAIVDLNEVNLPEEDRRKIEDTLGRHNTKFLGYRSSEREEKKEVASAGPPQVRKSLDAINEKKSVEIVNKTLRSGQKIEHDGDVLIIGDVNPDSYVVASGNIIVLGTLRGVVHAGASGDESAVVMALKLMPQQLRIASFFTRAPDVIEAPEYPERAFVDRKSVV